MKAFYEQNGNTIINDDCRRVLPALPPNHFATVITDPPYHLTQASRKGSTRQNDPATPFGRTRLGSAGFMGKTWDGGDVAFQPATWAAAIRVCRPGAFLLAFGGPRTFHRLTCAIEDGGWEIIDCICWMYGQGFPKAKSCLKPAWEPIIVARKAAKHVEQFNVAGARIPAADGVPQFTHRQEESKNCYGDGKNGSNRTGEIDTATGRWPANVMLDEDAAAMLDGEVGILESGKPAGVKAGGKLNCFGEFAGGIPVTGYGDAGGPSRFFYTSKAPQKERGRFNNHPTVKPLALMKYLCLLTDTDGEVLDLFGGSMTTAIAARECGRRCTSIELDPAHCEIGVKRLSQHVLDFTEGVA